jgi:hypothetical protein
MRLAPHSILNALIKRICLIELMLMNANWSDVLHGLESIRPIISCFKVTSQG